MSQKGDYPGYSQPSFNPVGQNYVGQGGRTDEVTLGNKEYMAMGDNSPDSSDSRYWGPVPEENLVGPALFVYWPFLPHFGVIR